MTAPPAVDAIALFARRLGKTPVVAADTPGFIVNRVARPFYLEALRILGVGRSRRRGRGRRHARHRLPDGAIRADRRHRRGRQPRRQRERPRAVLLRPALSSAPHPAHGRGRRTAGPQGGWWLLRLRARWRPDRALGDPRAPAGGTAPRHAQCRADRRPHLGGDRQRGCLRGRRGGGDAGGQSTPRCAWVRTTPSVHSNGASALGWSTWSGRSRDSTPRVPDGRYRVVPLLRTLAERHASFFAGS